MALTDLENLVHLAMTVGLTGPERRQKLMYGLPMGFVYSLPTVSRPIDQLRFDLMELERTPRLSGVDAPPLAVWLKNAAVLTAGDGKAEVARAFAVEADRRYPAGGASDAVEAALGRAAGPVGGAWAPSAGAAGTGAASHPAPAAPVSAPPSAHPSHPVGRRYVVLSMHPDAEGAWTTVTPAIDAQGREFIANTQPGRWYDKYAPHLPAWRHAVDNLGEAMTSMQKALDSRDGLAVFAVAPPALGALIGARLAEHAGRAGAIVVFERTRGSHSPWQPWGPAWSRTVTPEVSPRLKTPTYPTGGGDDVALIAELDGPLDEQAIGVALAHSTMPRVKVALDPQRPPQLGGAAEIEAAVRDLEDIVRAIEHRYRMRRLHVFYRGPLALMIRLGLYLPEHRFRTVVYADRGLDGYAPAVEVGGFAEASLVRAEQQPSDDGEGFDAFIAFASPDRAFAEQLHDALSAAGRRVFLDSRSLSFGDVWTDAIPAALAASQHVIAVISPATRDAWYQNDEFVQAIEQSRASKNARRVIPVLLDGLSPDRLPYGMRRLHALREAARDAYRVARALDPVLHKTP